MYAYAEITAIAAVHIAAAADGVRMASWRGELVPSIPAFCDLAGSSSSSPVSMPTVCW